MTVLAVLVSGLFETKEDKPKTKVAELFTKGN